MTPRISTACENTVSQGRFSTMSARPATSVLHLLLDEAELRYRERDHDNHQHHRLRRRAAEVARFDAVVVDLVHEDLRRTGGPALRRGVDHAESVEERVDDVHDEQEERRG